jgi:hypothetical protein
MPIANSDTRKIAGLKEKARTDVSIKIDGPKTTSNIKTGVTLARLGLKRSF